MVIHIKCLIIRADVIKYTPNYGLGAGAEEEFLSQWLVPANGNEPTMPPYVAY